MIAEPDSGAAARARMLASVGTVLLVLMPLAMWLANRSAPLMLGMAAAFFLAAALVGGERARMFDRARELLAQPLALAVLAFLCWALVSILWSSRPRPAFAVWLELVLPLFFTLAIAVSGRFAPGRQALRALAGAILLASVLVIIELASGLSQRATLGMGKLMSFVFNRPVIVACLLAVPAAFALRRPGRSSADVALAAVVLAVVAALALRSESASARLGVAVFLGCWVLARLLPRVALALTMAAFTLSMAVAPVLGTAAQRWLPGFVLERFNPMTGQARIDIWQSFGEIALARPLVGAGFGTSAFMREHPLAAMVSPEHQTLLAASHAHSMPVQAWAETGLVGVVLLTLAGLLLLFRLGRMPAPEMAPRLAFFAGAFAIASVGHGAWQGWWIAGLGAAVLWFSAPKPER